MIPWHICAFIALSIPMDPKHSVIKGLHCIIPRVHLVCRTNAGLDLTARKADWSIARGTWVKVQNCQNPELSKLRS